MLKKLLLYFTCIFLLISPFLFITTADINNYIASYIDSAAIEQLNTIKYNSTHKISSDLADISDASSTINGKWKGLCQKNSFVSVVGFEHVVRNDAVLAKYYANFNFANAKLGINNQETMAYVAHRSGDIIKKTKKPIKLPKGDIVISDGTTVVRAFCCNDIELPPPSAGNPDINMTPEAGVVQPELPIIYPEDPNYTALLSVYSPLSSSSNVTNTPVSTPVPETDTMLLFGMGILLLVYFKRK